VSEVNPTCDSLSPSMMGQACTPIAISQKKTAAQKYKHLQKIETLMNIQSISFPSN